MQEVKIRPTVPEEAELLARIQQAAFRPLYERYHDAGNPYLRGSEDILRKLNQSNRYFTIMSGGEIVGGIVYRTSGTRPPSEPIGDGEYYLTRVYIHPEHQCKGIAKAAILLCEREFADATVYYVDFPADLEKNRRCYEGVGYRDTGEILQLDGAPPLTMYRKDVHMINS